VLPDDFVGRVAHYFLRGAVPAGHTPRNIENEDRVVDDTFDQYFEMAPRPVELGTRIFKLAPNLIVHRNQIDLSPLTCCNCGGQYERRQRGAIDTASSNNCAALKSVLAKGKLPAASPRPPSRKK
jgi:hypothetical protein